MTMNAAAEGQQTLSIGVTQVRIGDTVLETYSDGPVQESRSVNILKKELVAISYRGSLKAVYRITGQDQQKNRVAWMASPWNRCFVVRR